MLSASVAAALVVLIGIALFLLLRGGTGSGPNRPPATSAVAASAENDGRTGNAAGRQQPLDTLAVLPFENLSADPEAGYLGDDITYSLTDSLARVRELKVRPYNSVARFKPGSLDAKAAGGELQVQAVLRGSIQQRGENVLIDVELIHVGEDRRLWGQRYQGKLTERLTLQQQIISGGARATAPVADRPGEADPGQAADAAVSKHTSCTRWAAWPGTGGPRRTFIRPLSTFSRRFRWTPAMPRPTRDWRTVISCCPSTDMTFPRRRSPRPARPRQQALALAPGLAEAHITLAEIHFYYDWDFVAAEREFLRALDLKPNYPTGRQWYGEFLSYLGRHSEAHRGTARGALPRSRFIHHSLRSGQGTILCAAVRRGHRPTGRDAPATAPVRLGAPLLGSEFDAERQSPRGDHGVGGGLATFGPVARCCTWPCCVCPRWRPREGARCSEAASAAVPGAKYVPPIDLGHHSCGPGRKRGGTGRSWNEAIEEAPARWSA